MIHQAKSNPKLLDAQIFSERLASAISAIGPLADVVVVSANVRFQG
jgi:hypothetical protein